MPHVGTAAPSKAPLPRQATIEHERIIQHPGPVQVTRRVKVRVPGKHFLNLLPAEQLEFYDGTAVEHKEWHSFPRHLKAWGAPHTGPGIRFLCDSDPPRETVCRARRTQPAQRPPARRCLPMGREPTFP